MRIFSYDSKFSQVLLRISQSCWLNLLWLICSLPVVTIGASTAALYSVTLKMADDSDTEHTKSFFASFRANFAQATRLWLLLLAAGAILGLDGYIVYRMRANSTGFMAVLWTINLALLAAAGIVYTIVLLYVFPLISKFENTDWAMLKNSFLIGVRYLFCTIVIFAVHFGMFFLAVAVFTPILIFGEGLVALVCSFFLIQVFRLVSVQKEETDA